MHALMEPVLLRITRFDALDADPEAQPPHGELAHPSINRATKRIRSSILDNSFQGISRLPQMPESVTHVLGKSVTYVPGRTKDIACDRAPGAV
jgi:hypothetical protein